VLKIRNLVRQNTGNETGQLLAVNQLDVAAGSCVSVEGQSGSGKSLFLRAVADLDPVDGEVFLDDVERNQISALDWRRQVAYVPAESGWWYNFVGGHFENQEAAMELVRRFYLSPDVFSWPVGQLSTGEKQRLSVIRTLMLNPKVLLLDEPTSGLDPQLTSYVEAELLDRLKAGICIILVSHDPEQRDRLASVQYGMSKGVL
jgi:ABC-type multidrug transport system ATPase subunit